MRTKKKDIQKLAARYPKIVEWSEEDGCFVGRCPTLFSGGIHGSTEATVYRELCETAEEWVVILHGEGIPLPASKRVGEYSGKFIVRVDPSVHQRLALKAAAAGESLNALVARTLTR